MTALPEYQRLECFGLWRETPQAQRREVIVALGDATLSISDERSARALTHWSLPALKRLNAGETPALFAPSDQIEGETLEISDAVMLAAIAKVQDMVEAARPHPGRLRGRLTYGAAALALCGLLYWLPDALIEHVAEAAPEAKQAEIGRMALASLSQLTGQPCHTQEGDAALTRLVARLNGPREIVVLPAALSGARLLPGGLVALGQPLLAAQDTPEVAAGHIIAAHLAGLEASPFAATLRWAGARTAFKLLTTGTLAPDALAGYGEYLLRESGGAPQEPEGPAMEALLREFSRTGVSSTPYAYSLDPTGEAVLGLLEADPFRGAPAPTPVMEDADWVALQTICDG